MEQSSDGEVGADLGFLKRGFICNKVWGFAMLILSHVFLKYPMNMK